VSIFADTIGTSNQIFAVSGARVANVLRDPTSEYCGTNNTSSYVSAISGKIFIETSSVGQIGNLSYARDYIEND
jgi:hypothetical protein